MCPFRAALLTSRSLTLDMGHMLLAGENPAQSVALVGAAGKLFGLQASRRCGGEVGYAHCSSLLFCLLAASGQTCRLMLVGEPNFP